MIKHIVCFKLKDNSEEKKQEAKDMLLSILFYRLHLKTGKHLISIRMTNTTAAWLNHICTV